MQIAETFQLIAGAVSIGIALTALLLLGVLCATQEDADGEDEL